jgi:hypothetical protein
VLTKAGAFEEKEELTSAEQRTTEGLIREFV